MFEIGGKCQNRPNFSILSLSLALSPPPPLSLYLPPSLSFFIQFSYSLHQRNGSDMPPTVNKTDANNQVKFDKVALISSSKSIDTLWIAFW